jgi:ion channel-forming bestrophin family protein
MILYDRLSWLSMVLRTHGSVVKKIWPRFLSVTLVSMVFTYVQRYPQFHFSLTLAPFLIVGLPLGIILGFRNTSSYDRFWEGRKLWGQLVNTSRSFTRQIDSYVIATKEDEKAALEKLRHRMIYGCIAVSRSLAKHLRGERDLDALKPLLDDDEIAKLKKEGSPPSAILHRLGKDVREAYERGWVDSRYANMLENSLVSLTDVLGGCERIKNTPTPISYLIFIHRAVALFCFLLPFGVADTVHNLTPVVVFFVSYALFSMDAIGDEIDNPFRQSENTLPLSTIARNIEIELRRRLGEKEEDLPKPLPAKHGVLT